MSRIIIADDEKRALNFYAEVLDYLGHEGTFCANGQEAVESFKKLPADLVILDYHMPVMDGLRACQKIRILPDGISVPVIIVSARNEEKIILKCLDAGASDYLIKPVEEDHLVAKLKTFLKSSSLHKNDFDLAKNHTLFVSRYRIEKLIGYGAHSIVFKARDIQNNDLNVALKLYNEQIIAENISKHIIETANKIRKVDSQNIIKIYEYGQYSGRMYLVSEYADGGNLSALLKSRKLSQLETVKLALDILQALKELENNKLQHFDIKPENILIGGADYKLCDFGIFVAPGSATIPIHSEIWSSAPYLSPEVLQDKERISSQSDVYSLGITLYEALTGDNPFRTDKPAVSMFRQCNFVPPKLIECDNSISSDLSDLVEAMLFKYPETRPVITDLLYLFGELYEILKKEPPVNNAIVEELPSQEAREAQEIPPEIAEEIAELEKKKLNFRKNIEKVTKRKAKKQSSIYTPHLFIPYVLAVLILGMIAAIGLSGGYYIIKTITWVSTEVQSVTAVVVCKDCGLVEERKIIDIKKDRCDACGKKSLTYGMECADCHYYFALDDSEVKGENREEIMRQMDLKYICPSCGSSNTKPIHRIKDKIEELNKHLIRENRE